MIRNRILWAGLIGLIVFPLMGCSACRNRCGGSSSYRPAFYAPAPVMAPAPACSSCQTSNAPPVVLPPG